MQFAGMNYAGIVAAAAASFIFGGAWYGLFGKSWMAALGKTEEDIKASGTVMPMVIAVIGLLIMAWVLAGVIGHLGPGQVTVRNGLISGAFCWLGFVATTLGVNYGFQGASRSLALIDGGHWLGVLLIQGAVIGLIGV
ncbi:MAG: DUF1761 domain-containing protein [Hyphomicrobiaceae bacterium]